MKGLVKAQPGQSVFLMPGQLYFGREAEQVRTLLGSCVAIVLWHPQRAMGGMCHYLLPVRTAPGNELDGRYGTEAFEMLLSAVRRCGTQPSEYDAYLYGGADTLPDNAGVKFNVGERNIEQGWTLLDEHGFMLNGVDVGDHVPRTVTLNARSGLVAVRRSERN